MGIQAILGHIITGYDEYTDGYLLIQDNKIIGVGHRSDLPTDIEIMLTTHKGDMIVPGFIDLHIHGKSGFDFMDADELAIAHIQRELPKEGTTSFLATTITQSKEKLVQALSSIYLAQQNESIDGATLLGVHLEGPFINKTKAGAQPANYIVAPSIETFKQFQSSAHGLIRLVTMAPETDPEFELLRYLVQEGVIVSIGHSDIDYETAKRAIAAGASHVTHLWNAMKPLHHRDPGLIGAVFQSDVIAELIVDGIHIHPEMVRLTTKNKQRSELILVTDSIRAKCLPPGEYELGGQAIYVSEIDARLQDGTLAGSILPMNEAIRNMMHYTDLPLLTVIQMATVQPARQLGIEAKKGSITPGRDADIVILDQNFQVKKSFVSGHLVYESGNLK